jgi:TfoX/Sxy family transcriptional regulator of competence genes
LQHGAVLVHSSLTMAWVKIPKQNHPLLLAALPRDSRVRIVTMFGGVCGLVNGHIFGGTFARSAMVRLAPDDLREALALDGAEPFDPMGNKRVMADTVLLPETVMDEPGELRGWLARGFAYTSTLPPKAKKRAARQGGARKAAPKRAASKPVQRAKRSGGRKAAVRKRVKA